MIDDIIRKQWYNDNYREEEEEEVIERKWKIIKSERLNEVERRLYIYVYV